MENDADPNTRDRGPGKEFERIAGPLRHQIKLHCYSMLGTLHEAEDAVQDAYLRAWRSFDGFDNRGPFRAWLYRIATNACLDAIARRKHARRFLPDQRNEPAVAMPDGIPALDVPWLEPYPGRDLENIADESPSPEARYSSHQSVRLAFVAAIQRLPPKQRVALLLCDVLGWSAGETAALLETSSAAVNSALQRARETLSKHKGDGSALPQPMNKEAEEELLRRYLQAWETLDLDGFISVLQEDAVYTMPPIRQWYAGRTAIRAFFERAWKPYLGYQMVGITANGQPAFAAYSRMRAEPSAPWTAHSIHVLSPEPSGLSRLTLFVKPEAPRLFREFGLPVVLSDPRP